MKPNPSELPFRNVSLARFALAGALFLTLASPRHLGAAAAAVYGGGPFYSGGTPVMSTLRSSGFTTVVLWTIHVYYPSGDLIFNDQKVCSGGAYVGAGTWPAQLATLKQAPTSVNRIEVCVGSGGVNDFAAVQQLIASGGTNSSSILYRNFQALIAATGADAICFNDETLYDVPTLVTFGQMLASLGCKVTLCPYNNPSIWQSVKAQLGAGVDAVYLQCYAGGAGNDPATWNGYFGGLKVQPGLWCKHGSGCASGDSAATVETRMTNWKSSVGITGGFLWLFDDMLACTASTPAQYAAAITGVPVNPGVSVWNGVGGNDNWSTAANWDYVPINGATLLFDGTTRLAPHQDSVVVTNFAALWFKATAGGFNLGGKGIALSAILENDSASAQTVDLPIDLGSGVNLQAYTKLNSGDLTLSGVLSGPGGLWKSQQAASTTLLLSGANTYSGATAINAGNVSITAIKPMGSASPSSLGKPAPGNGDIACGGGAANPCALTYTGAGDTTDRGLWLNTTALGAPLTLRQSGTGLLKFTGNFWATSSDATQRRLILDGATSGTGELASAVTNTTFGSTGIQIVKNGTGTWALSGTNTTVSATSITAGKLVGVAGGSSSNSACTVSANATNGVRVLSPGGQWAYKTLTFNAGSYAEFDFGDRVVPSAAAAPLVVSNLTFVGTAGFGILAGALIPPGTYPLIRYAGRLSGTPPSNVNLPPQVAGTIVNNLAAKSIDLQVTGVTPAQPIQYIIHISADGMHADAPRTLVKSGWGTHFSRLFAESAYTEQARTDFSSTVTSPNHATIFSSRPVYDWPGRTGHLWGNNDTWPWDRWGLTLQDPHFVGTNYGPGPTPMFTDPYVYAFGPSKTNYEYISSVLDVVHDNGKRTCLIYSKNRLMEEEKSYDATHGRLAPDHGPGDPGVAKVDFALYTNSDSVVSNWMAQTSASPFEYSFLHFSLPDDYGHAYSWSLTNGWTLDPYPRWLRLSYMYAIQKVDGYLGQIFSMVETNPVLRGKTAIILTADHGGLLEAYDHGWTDQPDCFRVDVFVWGPGIAAGVDLYQLNPQYTHPGGTGRPDYAAAQPPIRNGDTANLALSLLGLGPIPGSSLNASQTLTAAATHLTCVVTGTNLTVSWPAGQLGWRLLVQTNPLSLGLGTNWSAWPDSTQGTRATIPVVSASGSVFFKLAPPSP